MVIKELILLISSIFWMNESLRVKASSHDTPPSIDAWVHKVISAIIKFFRFLRSLLLTTVPNSPSGLDFKSNKKIEFEGYKHQKLLLPLDKYEDCNYRA